MGEIKENSEIVDKGMLALTNSAKEKEKKEKEKHKLWITHYLFFIVMTAVIVYIFPSGNKFRFSYELGKPWIYESLTAPGSFPIMKSAEELQNDYDMLLKQYYTPYFSRIENSTEKSLESFEKGSKKAETRHGEEYTLYIKKALYKVCSNGIIGNTDMDEILRLGINKVKLKHVGKDGVAYYSDQNADLLFTEKTAYEYIIKNAPPSLETKSLQDFNINEYIKPTLDFEKDLSAKQKEDIRNLISKTKGMVQDGQKIIDRGEIVSTDSYRILNSLKHETEVGNMGSTSQTAGLGQGLCVACILTALFLYFVLFRDFYINNRRMMFVLGMIIGMCALTAYVTKMSYEVKVLSVYIIPYALVPITVSAFFDTRTALFTHLTTVLICSLIAPHEFEFLLLQILIGMICISTLKTFYQRSQLFKTVCTIAAVYIMTYLGLTLTHTVGWSENDTITMVSFVVNAALLLFAYPLIFIFEKTFNFTSDITLVELTNSNSPLLRKFSEVAPGSFNHSLQVSNLASNAAEHINCNALLARAGALYHDIGKMANPVYFTENQNGGFNPTNDLPIMESVSIIAGHVTNGLKIAKDNGLPSQIRDFIESHHGKSTVRYFFRTYCNNHPDEEVNEEDFRYKGKLPSTKEEVVVMICDSVEAASKSMTDYTGDKIDALVDNIVNLQLSEGSYADAPITLKEIETVKSVLKEKLRGIYHTRIRYPELNKPKKTK